MRCKGKRRRAAAAHGRPPHIHSHRLPRHPAACLLPEPKPIRPIAHTTRSYLAGGRKGPAGAKRPPKAVLLKKAEQQRAELEALAGTEEGKVGAGRMRGVGATGWERLNGWERLDRWMVGWARLGRSGNG